MGSISLRNGIGVNLTAREFEMLLLAAKGMGTIEMAVLTGISSRTVKFHFANILKKMEVSNRTEAVAYAIRNALIE